MIRRLVLVRHGETDANAQGRTIATSDPSLNELGRTQAARIADALSDTPFSRVVSSPRARCRETAEQIVARQRGRLTIELDERLIELGMGAFEGRSADELEADGLGDVFRSWRQRVPPAFPAGAETFDDAADRLAEVFRDVGSGPGVTLVVGHSHALRILIATQVLGGTAHTHRRLFLGHATVTDVQWERETPRLVALNSSSIASAERGQ